MKTMNLPRVALLLLLGFPLRMVLAQDLPKPFAIARYQTMMDRSPFAVATTVAPVVAPNFAKDLYIANAARNSAEGDLVTLASTTDKMFKRYLTTKTPADGYSIVGIEWSDKVGATKVTIGKDGQTATLSFNEALLRAPAGPGQIPGQNPAAQPAMQPGTDGPRTIHLRRPRRRLRRCPGRCRLFPGPSPRSWSAAERHQADAGAAVTDSTSARPWRDPTQSGAAIEGG